MDIEKRLAEIVESKLTTITKLASATGVDYQTLTRCLKGEQRLKADEFLAVCKVLDIDPREFVSKENV